MLFSWLQRRRRRKILAAPFPAEWNDYLQRNVAHYRYLTPREQARLRDDLRIFVAEKNWEGCGGLAMTDEIKVSIAAQACLLVLGMEHNYFDRVRSVLVYPHGFVDPRESAGPVILSWSEVRDEGRNPRQGHNVVFHEFAHQLDMLDGVINGAPPLPDREQRERWQRVMTAEYRRLLDASAHGRATLLDQYGTTNEGEFFAVATECFFDRPADMERRHPELYDLLRTYYRQDPAARFAHKQKVLAHPDRELGGSTVL
jgi:MtfA peptidase